MQNENKIYVLLEKMYSDFNTHFTNLEKTTDAIKKQINKNSLILKKIQSNVKILLD